MLLTVLLILTVVAHLWVPVPFIPTSAKVVDHMIALANLQGTEHVFDLGAGDARFLIAAKRKYPSITAIGCELHPTVWLLGTLRVGFSRMQVQLQLQDALRMHVSSADVVFLYLFPSIMEQLKEKFDAELKPGTRVITYAFAFPGKTAVQEELVPWMNTQRKVRVYVW